RERRLGVDFELMHVELFAKDLLNRLYHARMRGKQPERLVIKMSGKCRARGTALFAPDFRPVGVVDAHRLGRQEIDFLRAEQLGKKKPAFAVENLDLLSRQFHRVFLLTRMLRSRRHVAVCKQSSRRGGENHPAKNSITSLQYSSGACSNIQWRAP